MQKVGFALFIVGVIVASWYAARFVPDDQIEVQGPPAAMDRLSAWGDVAGIPFAIGAILMIGGGILARRSTGSPVPLDNTAEGGNTGAMLQRIHDAVYQLPEADPRENAQRLHVALDQILEDLVPGFLEQRQHHIEVLGLARYAEMSSTFASAERALGRAWSALTDEAWAEVTPCIANARRAIAAANALVNESS